MLHANSEIVHYFPLFHREEMKGMENRRRQDGKYQSQVVLLVLSK